MIKEFKEFAFKGNVLDLAVAVIIGAAFGKIVTAVVDNLLRRSKDRLWNGHPEHNRFSDRSILYLPCCKGCK